MGNTGGYEYELSLGLNNRAVFERISISADTTDVLDDELVESPLLYRESQ